MIGANCGSMKLKDLEAQIWIGAYQNELTVARGRGADNGCTVCPWRLLAET